MTSFVADSCPVASGRETHPGQMNLTISLPLKMEARAAQCILVRFHTETGRCHIGVDPSMSSAAERKMRKAARKWNEPEMGPTLKRTKFESTKGDSKQQPEAEETTTKKRVSFAEGKAIFFAACKKENVVPKGEYVSSTAHVACTCNVCERSFLRQPRGVIQGRPVCPRCPGEPQTRTAADGETPIEVSLQKRKLRSPDDLRALLTKLCREQNSTVVGDYLDITSKVEIECAVCGLTSSRIPRTIIDGGRVCKHCLTVVKSEKKQNPRVKNAKKTKNETEELFRMRCAEEGSIPQKYVDIKTKVFCECTVCGLKTDRLPRSVINGQPACPRCPGANKQLSHIGLVDASSETDDNGEPEKKLTERSPESLNTEENFRRCCVDQRFTLTGEYTRALTRVAGVCQICERPAHPLPKSVNRGGKACPNCPGRVIKRTHEDQKTAQVLENPIPKTVKRTPEEAKETFKDRCGGQNLAIKGEYINSRTEVECECLGCNRVYHVFPGRLAEGQTICVRCRDKKPNNERTSPKESGIVWKELCGVQNIVPQGPFVNVSTSVKFKCGVCGRIGFSKPMSVIAGHAACLYCIRGCWKAELYFKQEVGKQGGKLRGLYISTDTPVPVECKKGHVNLIRPGSVQTGQGICKTCVGLDPKTAEANFRSSVVDRLKGTVDGPYADMKTTVACTCACGNKVQIRPDHVTAGGGMCRICAGNDPIAASKRFADEVKRQGGDLLGVYVNASTRVKIRCAKNHTAYALPNYVRSGAGICARCSQPRGEILCSRLLTEMNVKFSPQFQLPGNSLKYDFGGDNFVLEFDGEQHFERCGYFHKTDAQFEAQRDRDVLKTYQALKSGRRVIRFDYRLLSHKIDKARALFVELFTSTESLTVSDPALYDWIRNDHKIKAVLAPAASVAATAAA
jgi:hypothetical protein